MLLRRCNEMSATGRKKPGFFWRNEKKPGRKKGGVAASLSYNCSGQSTDFRRKVGMSYWSSSSSMKETAGLMRVVFSFC